MKKPRVKPGPVAMPDMPTEKIIVPRLPDWLNRRVLALQASGRPRRDALRPSPLLVLLTTLTITG